MSQVTLTEKAKNPDTGAAGSASGTDNEVGTSVYRIPRRIKPKGTVVRMLHVSDMKNQTGGECGSLPPGSFAVIHTRWRVRSTAVLLILNGSI